MMGSEVIIVPAVILGFVTVVRIISENRLKRNLIDKGMVNEDIKFLSQNYMENPLTAVKWGLVLIGLGGALFAGQLLDLREEGTIGLMMLLAGGGFITYYFLANNESRNSTSS